VDEDLLVSVTADDHVVVVGAGLAGWRFCEELRRRGYAGELTLVGEEPHEPYDRPPLSKQVAEGKWGLERTNLVTDERRRATPLTWRLSERAVELKAEVPLVRLDSGEMLFATRVVIATGVRARTLPWTSAETITLRRREDAERLNRALSAMDAGDEVVVVGAGFIGAEVATALVRRGVAVTVLESSDLPLQRVLGEAVARAVLAKATGAGVSVRTNVTILDIQSEGGYSHVHLADGTELRARVILAGVGAEPALEWIAGSGLALSQGILVNEHFEARARVGALGDIARFPWRGEPTRLEHWQVAHDSAMTLAAWWASGEALAPLVPYFWSDQYGHKIQVLGRPRASATVHVVRGDLGEGRFVALYEESGEVTAIVTLDHPRALMLSRDLLVQPTSLDEALSRAPWEG
jgi:NADPH-dependent 2,4-dienoyl-CoA reductase/sulfur reductase-like enzyme